MPTVSTDGYTRYGHPHCRCEDFDGERKCDWCIEQQFTAEIQRREALEEERRMAHKFGAGSW
jgi:hypothetical protein